MPKRIMPLTDIQVKNAKPKEKEYKLMDGYSLFLLVTPLTANYGVLTTDLTINGPR